MTENLNPLTDKERKRILRIVKNLLYGSGGMGYKTDTHKAVARHLKRLDLKYPLTLTLQNSKMIDVLKIENEEQLIAAMKHGPGVGALKSSGTEIMDARDTEQVSRTNEIFKEDFEVDIEFNPQTD